MEYISFILYDQGEQTEIFVPSDVDITKLWMYVDKIKIKEEE
jgi:hypothetical protein